MIKHEDARSGTQYVAVTEVNRHEPDPSTFAVPGNYKVVDETPPTVESAAAGH
ncbi:hypothetical protein [Granulicella sibirica]|uniref:Uncharacterized protein n=1 Tax=Granulicella sibirica TaxID=2479048 RepID=A0A4Q0SVL8_9BACT|nr:hypothetical protein [Granulicella sibirica]RXH55073.1 hypothetical protein GRAN_4177 [Granulicella sibirica]